MDIYTLTVFICLPDCPSLISRTVSVDVKHHVYLLYLFTCCLHHYFVSVCFRFQVFQVRALIRFWFLQELCRLKQLQFLANLAFD